MLQATRGTARPPAGDAPAGDGRTTRERILDIARDLFVDKGYDKASLRDIAEALGFSKAAIYYHFESKADILLALHQRLHDFGHRAITRLGKTPRGVSTWAQLLDETIVEMLENRKIFVMHQRNWSAVEEVHQVGHDGEHGDLEEQIRALMSDPSMPLRDRVRLACAVGAIMAGLIVSNEMLKDVSSEELGAMLRETVGDIVGRPLLSE
jgi:AcrR family transcriptional regulator